MSQITEEVNGAQGSTGKKGIKGYQGTQGTAGAQGADGDQGADGEEGLKIAEVKAAIDNYLSAGSAALMLPTEKILEMYLDNVAGFKDAKANIIEERKKADEIKKAAKEEADKAAYDKMSDEEKLKYDESKAYREAAEKELAEMNGEQVQDEGITEEEIDEMVAEERKKALAKLKEAGSQVKKEIDNKINSLKAAISDIKLTSQDIAKDLAKSAADAIVPVSIGPVAPNPIHNALRLYLNVSAIKKSIDSILRAASFALGLIDELGIGESALALEIAKLVEPLLKHKKDAEDSAIEADAVGESPDVSAAHAALKKKYTDKWNYNSRSFNGEEIEEKLQMDHNTTVPMSADQLRHFEWVDTNSSMQESVRLWARLYLRYNEWHIKNII